MKGPVKLIGLLSILSFFPIIALSATIHVPADQSTIQAGIDSANTGDTVLVADGTYAGDGNRDIDFSGKGIVLKSVNGPDFTIIDCQGSSADPHRGFNFHSGEDSTAVVDGFTIQGGFGLDDPSGASVGGGIMCDSSSSPKIINNTISGNSASKGGGIYCNDYSSPTITNNTISGNSVGYLGGGIYCGYSDATITNNIISGNSSGGGGGISCYGSSPTISSNTICDNAGYYGYAGGISCWYSNPTISNNTISVNFDGGISCHQSSPIITNTIVWANINFEISVDGTSSPVITYCDIQGGWEGEDNIDSNPLFLDPYSGNYNVCSQSPCIDAGDPDMTDPDGTRSDIGVFYPEHPECVFGNVWHVSTTGNDTTGDGSPENPFRTIQHAINGSLSSDTVIVQNGTYVENIHINLKNIILASNYMYSGDTLDIQNTIIDGDSVSSVVTFQFCDSLTAITGFTIRNKSAGGIYCSNSSPTISNNTISGNSSAQHWGAGGILCWGSSPTIINNTISGNSAQYGGGIYCVLSSPTISDNTISGNSANLGGGIRCYAGSSPTIGNNTISGNSASKGGGIHCSSESNPAISNTIIAFSSQGEAVYCDENSNPVLTCCDVFGNEGGDWLGCIAEQAEINGNFSADPLFCDTANGDYHISNNSPCAPANNDCGELIGVLGVGCDAEFTQVYFDIKPGSCPNPINIKIKENGKAVIPAAILGTEDIDVHDIDVSSLTLLGVSPVRYNYDDVSAPAETDDSCGCSEEGPDGHEDLTLKFNRQALVAALMQQPLTETIRLTISGQLIDSTNIEGSDCVVIRPKRDGEIVGLDGGSGNIIVISGDVSGDNQVNLVDVALMIEFLYRDGKNAAFIVNAADVNATGTVNILDITYLIAYLYKEGPAPVCQ